jgi:hypothetical protein
LPSRKHRAERTSTNLLVQVITSERLTEFHPAANRVGFDAAVEIDGASSGSKPSRFDAAVEIDAISFSRKPGRFDAATEIGSR